MRNYRDELHGTNTQRYRKPQILGLVNKPFRQKAVYGYHGGGVTATGGTGTTAIFERNVFSTGIVSANSVSNLSGARRFGAGVSDTSLYGYFIGGVTVKTADRLNFSTGITAVNSASQLSTARYACSGISDGVNYGYVRGGYTGAVSKICDRINFATSITALNSVGNLGTGCEKGFSLSDPTSYGYTRIEPSFHGDRLNFSTGISNVNSVSNRTINGAYYGFAPISDGVSYGYMCGGSTNVSVGLQTIDRLNFSTQILASNSSSLLSVGRFYAIGNSDGSTYGYIYGGQSGGTGTQLASTDRMVFSTGIVLANSVSNISTTRNQATAISDYCV